MYVNFSNKVSVLLVKNDYAVAFDEVDYSKTLLDFLYNRANMCGVSELIVISHSVLSDTVFKNSGIAYTTIINNTPMYALVNIIDIDKICEVAKAARIEKIRFVDSLGMCCMLGEDGVCYVEQINGMYTLICVKDKTIFDYRICSKASLHSSVHSFCVKNNLTRFEDVSNLCTYDLLLTFYNIMSLNDTAKDLMVFAYAETPFAEAYSYTRESMAELFVKLNNVPLLNEEHLQTLSSEVHAPTEHSKTVPQEKRSKKIENTVFGRRDNTRGKLLSVVMIASFILIVAVNIGNYLIRAQATKIQKDLLTKESEITELQNQYNLYQLYASAKANGVLFSCLESLGINTENVVLPNGEQYSFSGQLSSVNLKGNQVCLVIAFNSEEDANCFISVVSNFYKITSQSITPVTGESGSTSYSLSVVFSEE